ncbi:MAG: ABC transporter ATP-binding protein, partial [bacterium]
MTLNVKFRRVLLLRRLLGIVWESAPGTTLLRLVLLVLQAVLPLASLYLMKLAIEAVTASLQSSGAGFEHVLWLIAALGGTTLANALCGSLAVLASEIQGLAVT